MGDRLVRSSRRHTRLSSWLPSSALTSRSSWRDTGSGCSSCWMIRQLCPVILARRIPRPHRPDRFSMMRRMICGTGGWTWRKCLWAVVAVVGVLRAMPTPEEVEVEIGNMDRVIPWSLGIPRLWLLKGVSWGVLHLPRLRPKAYSQSHSNRVLSRGVGMVMAMGA